MNGNENKETAKIKRSSKISVGMVIIFVSVILCAALVVTTLFIPSIYKGGNSESNTTNDTSADTSENAAVPDDIPEATVSKEVRGVYIASVYNINFPTKQGLSANELKAELDDIIKTCLEANLNTIYFQVRPSSDALYRSEIFPVSKYLTGEQGSELPEGFDPLEYLVTTAHDKGLAVHAWVNPLRVTVGSAVAPEHDTSVLAVSHPVYKNPEYAVAYADGRLYLDCGIPEVRALVAEGVREIAANYEVDGIIFDDYFYPYPVNGDDGKPAVFDDTASFGIYGNGAELADWRRGNVNLMIEDCYNAIKSVNADCKFGVAPFGIWQNDNGENGGSETKGLESYSAIYCDPIAWIKGGYIDYIAPQVYWRFNTSVARYDVLTRWWNTIVEGTGVELIISHGAYNYDTWEAPQNEMRSQIEFARSLLSCKGSILYGYDALKRNSNGLFDEVKAVFSETLTEDRAVVNDKLILALPASGTYVNGSNTYVIGTSDPNEPLYVDGERVGRTKSGYFSLYLPLEEGKNTFVFSHKGEDTEYIIYKGAKPSNPTDTITYPTLESPEIGEVTPSQDWFGSGTLQVSAVAPKGATVTATLGDKTITLKPTVNSPSQKGSYMKEIYVGNIKLSADDGEVTDMGSVKFTSKYGGKTYTKESANVRVLGNGAYVPVEVLADDTELKVQTDSWYYDDYTPQSAGMRDNAIRLGGGMYKLRCGGYIYADTVKELDGEAIGVAEVTSAEMSVDGDATYVRFKVSENIPINCNMAKNEFKLTLYNINTADAPEIKLVKNPLFTSVKGEKTVKSGAYNYVFTLVDIENFYGFDHYYEDGYLVIKWKNPQTLPDTDTPLEGKTIILDAGHGGQNPGALGPLGKTEGAVNESDFNLKIVLAAERYLTELGAEVIQIRDANCEIDVPINDRLQTLIDTEPDMVISIHQNSMEYTVDITKIRGVVGLYWSDSGYMLTDILGNSIAAALNKPDRSPTKQRLAMVRNQKFPSTLIETCFITSVEEYERMMKPDTVDKIARAISDGVMEYYKVQGKYVLD